MDSHWESQAAGDVRHDVIILILEYPRDFLILILEYHGDSRLRLSLIGPSSNVGAGATGSGSGETCVGNFAFFFSFLGGLGLSYQFL